mgnify:FL=1
MGMSRSGKSSIQKVVFHKMSPHETLFLESTTKIVKNDIANNSFVQFQVFDLPGQVDFFDTAFDAGQIFGHGGAVVFVVDAMSDYSEALNKLYLTMQKAYSVNRNIKFDIFIHKIDGLSDDHKTECKRDIQAQVDSEMQELNIEPQLAVHMTSIYDHSIFEAMSKVIQRLIPQLPHLESLLDMLTSSSRLEKTFLFDVVSKIYIATDTVSPMDNYLYELCSDMIDVVVDISCIYGVSGEEGAEGYGYDPESASVIKLNNKDVLYLREVNQYLALVCILKEENFDKIGLINYNFACFKDAIEAIFTVARGGRPVLPAMVEELP